MKLLSLKRAIVGFLSAMLIVCMPLAGISAGALDSTTQVLLMAQGGHFGDDVSYVSKNITLTSENKMPAGTLAEEPTKDGYVFGYWSTYRELDEGGSTLDRVTEDYVFTDANINGGNIQIDANWYNQCTEISVSGEVQIYNGYALPDADETKETPFTVGKNDSAKPTTAEWYYITKGTAFDIKTATKYTSGDADTDTYDYYIVMTLNVSSTYYRFKDAPTFKTKDIAPATAIEFNKDTVAFAWKAVPYEMITEITEVSINPDVTASDYTLSAGDFPEEFTGTVKGTTKSGKTITMSNLFTCLWYEAGKVGGENRPASTAEDGKTYVPGFVFMPPEKCYAASSEVMAGMENAKVSASLSAAGYGVDPVEGLVLITGPEITVGAGSSSDPLHDTPIVYLEDVTVEPADGDTTGTSFVFKNIPQLTTQETAAGFAYVYSIQSTKDILPPENMAEDYNAPIRSGGKTPSESSIYADVCNDIPDDLKITVTEESMIIFVKVNKTDPNYRQTIDEDSAYFVLAAKAIPVTPTVSSDPLLDTPIAYLKDVTLELADDDTTGTSFVFKNVPQLTEEEVAAGFEYIYSVQPTGSASPDDIAADFNEMIAEEDTKPAESTIDVTLCIDLPKDLKITVDANSIILFTKVNRKNPSYLETSAEGSAYFTFAQKVIAVTPGKSAGPTVTFDVNNGTLPAGVTNPVETVNGKLAELPVPTRDNYVFVGWYDKATDEKITTETVFTADATVIAKWVPAVDCVKSLSVMNSSYVAFNGYTLVLNPNIPSLLYNYSFSNYGNNIPAAPASTGAPVYYYVTKNAAFSLDTATRYDGTTKVDSSKYDYYFVQKINTVDGLSIYDTPELKTELTSTKVESFDEHSVTISCKADVYEVISQINEITLDPDVLANGYKFNQNTPYEFNATAKVTTLTGNDMQITGYGYFLDSDGIQTDTFKSDTKYTPVIVLPSSNEPAYVFAKAGATSIADAAVSAAVAKAGIKLGQIGPMGAGMMMTADALSYSAQAQTDAEIAAEKIGAALDSFKPANDTVKSDVQTIIDKNKNGTTATITTFTLTPATNDKTGSLKVVITISDGKGNTETVEKNYVISKLPDSTGDVIVDTGDNVGGAGIDGTQVKNAVDITPEEQALLDNGENLHIILNVQNADSTISADDKALMQSVISDRKIGMYLDITLLKKIGALQTIVSKTNAPITITFVMPNSLINTDKNVTREYFVIRVHNGKAEILSCAFNSATGKASFNTDKFSSYAIAYKDKNNSSVTPSPVNPGAANSKPDSSFTHKLNVTAEAQNGTVTLSWDKIGNADSYIVYQLKDGKYVEIETVKETSVTFDNLTNGATYKYMIKYTVDGRTCSDSYACKVSVKVYYKLNVTAEIQGKAITLSWDEIENADSYTVYQLKNGKYVKVKTTNDTSVTFNNRTNGKTYKYMVKYTMNGKKCSADYADKVSVKMYYKLNVAVETQGNSVTLSWNKIKNADSYTVYQLKNGKYVKVKTTKGTSVTFDNLTNGKTYKYMVKYTMNGKKCPADYADKVSVKMYYKPAVTATADKNSVKLSWKSVSGAEKYAIYMYADGKAVKLAELDKNSALLTELKSDTEYQYIVSAYVDNEWTAMLKSDILTVKTKA